MTRIDDFKFQGRLDPSLPVQTYVYRRADRILRTANLFGMGTHPYEKIIGSSRLIIYEQVYDPVHDRIDPSIYEMWFKQCK